MWVKPEDIDHWITMEGNKVPVAKGQSDEDACKAFIAEKQKKKDRSEPQGKDRKARAADDDKTTIRSQVEAHKDDFKGKKPVAEITGEAATDFQTAVRSLKFQLQKSGGVVTRKGFGDVQVSSRLFDAKKYLVGQDDVEAIAAIPAVIKKGKVIAEHENHKGRGYGTVTFAAKIKIGKKVAIMGVVVKKTTGNFYAVHRAFTLDDE